MKYPVNLTWIVVLGLALGVGLCGRLHSLGSRPLAVDEYYFISSVHLVLDKWVPKHDLGGYYTRGAPFQYLVAASVLALGDNGLAYRLPGALLSLLAVFLAYRYCRFHLEPLGASFVAAALLLSAWEIEFARFARMYVPLQCLVLGLLIAVEWSLKSQCDRRAHLTACGLALVATLVHPLAVALLPLLFLAPLGNWLSSDDTSPERRSLAWTALATVTSLVACTYALAEPGLERLGVTDPFPLGFNAPAARPFVEPAFPFLGLGDWRWTPLALLLGLVAAALVVVRCEKRKITTEQGRTLLLWLVLAAAALHQLVLVALLTALLHFRFKLFSRAILGDRKTRFLVAASGVVTLCWLGFALTHQTTLLSVAPSDLPKSFRLTFLGWPDFYDPFVEPWLRFMPLLTLLLGVSLLVQTVASLRQPLVTALRNPALPWVSFLLFVGVMRSHYHTTRYSFFLYPVALCLILVTLRDVQRKYLPRLRLAAPFVFALLFLLSQDFQPGQALAVASEAVSYRTGPYEKFRDHWFRRDDLRSVARYLNNRTEPTQPLIVSDAEHEMPFYLKRPFALYFSTRRHEFAEIARQRGTRDKWSGARLLTSRKELLGYVRGHATVWVTRRVETWNRPFEIEEVWGAELDSAQVVYTSRDGRVEIVKVTLGEPDEAESGPGAEPSGGSGNSSVSRED